MRHGGRTRGVWLDKNLATLAVEQEGRTDEWLAAKSKVSKRHMQQALNGKRALSHSSFELLCQALCRAPGSLVNEQEMVA